MASTCSSLGYLQVSLFCLYIICRNLFLTCFRNLKPSEQEALLELLWQLWPLLPTYGRKAAQFVDLLGYFSLRYTQNVDAVIEKVINKQIVF